MNLIQKVIKYASMTLAVFLAVCIISFAIETVGNIVCFLDDEKTYKEENSEMNFSKEFTDVEKLDIRNAAGKLIIKSGGDRFIVEGINVSDSFRAEEDNGTFYIEEENFLKKIFNINTYRSDAKSTITVYVPAYFTAREIKIDSGTGNVILKDLSAENLIIDGGAASIDGDNIIITQSVMLESGVGNITLNNVQLSNVNYDSGVGNLKIEGVISGDSVFDCGVGKVKLNINGSRKDYKLQIDSSIGNVRVNGEKMQSDYQDMGPAPNTISIDSGVGNVDLEFSF